MSTDHKKRIDYLERNIPATVTPEVQAYAERLAREYHMSVDEIFAEAERVAQRFGRDAPIETVAAGIAQDHGVTVDEILDLAREILNNTTEGSNS